jgi:hypothetical protein
MVDGKEAKEVIEQISSDYQSYRKELLEEMAV